MKDIATDLTNDIIDGEKPEPFATIVDLAEDYSKLERIDAIQLLADLDSERDDSCANCREQDAWISLQLQEVLAKYERRFQRNAVAKINCGIIKV
jgi:hypothetical protein